MFTALGKKEKKRKEKGEKIKEKKIEETNRKTATGTGYSSSAFCTKTLSLSVIAVVLSDKNVVAICNSSSAVCAKTL